MSKQHGFPALLEPLVLTRMDRGDHVRKAEPFQARNPVGPDPERHQGRSRFDDRMAEPPRDRIAIAGRAATRIRRSPDRDDHSPRRHVESGSLDLEKRVSAGDPASSARLSSTGLWQRSVAPERSSRRTSASSTSVARSDTGKILPLPSILVATPASSNIRTVASTSKRRRRGTEERAVVAERLLDGPDAARLRAVVSRVDRARHGLEPAQASGIGDIATCAPGHEDLDAGPPVLFNADHACAAFRGPRGGHQSRGPRAEDRPHRNRNPLIGTQFEFRSDTESKHCEHASHRFHVPGGQFKSLLELPFANSDSRRSN